MPKSQNMALLFELLRSYTALARTLNLSKAVRELGSTRQTVRRHISQLEQSKGVALFTLEDRQYRLTKAGEQSLREAKDLLARGEAWLNNQSDHIQGLSHLAFADSPKPYYLQQHPLGDLWTGGSDLLQQGFLQWAKSKGDIESEDFSIIRQYLMVFRPADQDWVCVEIGEKSSYASWHGWEWERSSIGRGVADLPGGSVFADMLAKPFQEVKETQGVRLDHIHTHLTDKDGKILVPISYQRLLMSCRFADGSLAMAALIDRTHNISILGLDDDTAKSMPREFVMDIDTNTLKTSH